MPNKVVKKNAKKMILVNKIPDEIPDELIRVCESVKVEQTIPDVVVPVEPVPCAACVEDPAVMTVPELRKLCKSRGIKGYSKLNKQGIVALLV